MVIFSLFLSKGATTLSKGSINCIIRFINLINWCIFSLFFIKRFNYVIRFINIIEVSSVYFYLTSLNEVSSIYFSLIDLPISLESLQLDEVSSVFFFTRRFSNIIQFIILINQSFINYYFIRRFNNIIFIIFTNCIGIVYISNN